MSEFYINIPTTKDAANNMSSIGGQLKSSAAQINSACGQLRRNQDTSMSLIAERLNEVRDSIINEAVKAESLAGALTQIVTKYSAAETAICGSADKIMGSQTNQNSSAEKSWWEKLIDWVKELLGIKEEELSPECQAEREHDLYMQESIFALFDQDRFSESTWRNASLEERKAILESFMVEVSLIMGISLDGPVNFFYEAPQNGLITNGFFTDETNMIYLNTYVIEGAGSYSIMKTMIHEMRHAYQYAAINHPENYTVSPETIRQWEENFKPENYIRGEDDFDAYQAQPIEYDANSFAKNYGSTRGVDPVYRGSW